ncbi:hypothetical protein ANN_09991 [Periplaneta americana]|uniref:Uncharacterized protein n=1 Tax=Periplaneta americana TaxID=6978 RepID=A0ABQ8TPC0_PERAM|nr:hypothetical protein ANN_09991 [Periplaneta americana]
MDDDDDDDDDGKGLCRHNVQGSPNTLIVSSAAFSVTQCKQTAEIIDPTIRFEISATQPSEVNEEKKKIYEPTISTYRRNTKKKSQLQVSSSEREAPFRKPL